MANKYTRRCSPLVIREMHTKMTMRYHLVPSRIATRMISVDKAVEKPESSDIAGGNVE